MSVYHSSQKGFTLIELMISVVLGLLIVAAVTQVYVMAMRTASTQRASAGILDANVYGLQQVERSLRMAGLGLGDQSRLNSTCSGVLIRGEDATLKECPTVTGVNRDVQKDADGNITNITTPARPSPVANLGENMWTSPTTSGVTANTTSASMPQLTIQYRAPVDMLDCEGRLALGPRQVIGESASKKSETKVNEEGETTREPIMVDGQVIIERYFVQRNTDGVLELRCDAMRYVPETIETDNHARAGVAAARINAAKITDANIHNPDNASALVIAGIDDFQVQFGTQVIDPSGNKGIRYRTVAEYQNLSDTKEAPINEDIVAIKMGIVAKGLVATAGSDAPTNPTYTILGQSVSIRAGQPANAIRRVYESNTMLRNSRGAS